MKKGPGRPRKYPHGVVVVTITLPKEVLEKLDRERKALSLSRGEFISLLLEHYRH
ncbi:ribbon-helix-helix domain-containing protein [Thermococcus sp. SY098]|uniref:ribbon-helix-helix domain-containing protein n=1 Tax=Thermococcus sp. SY098 TaxID=3111325 RepID=UPI002D79EE42|nr:ribbon-helix-helix domain-containing protein [Thermococcus sp. SY098]WRS51823.1 ribbon-helix-helix domain-containing protein [Thermococcus sp. SY098]